MMHYISHCSPRTLYNLCYFCFISTYTYIIVVASICTTSSNCCISEYSCYGNVRLNDDSKSHRSLVHNSKSCRLHKYIEGHYSGRTTFIKGEHYSPVTTVLGWTTFIAKGGHYSLVNNVWGTVFTRGHEYCPGDMKGGERSTL